MTPAETSEGYHIRASPGTGAGIRLGSSRAREVAVSYAIRSRLEREAHFVLAYVALVGRTASARAGTVNPDSRGNRLSHLAGGCVMLYELRTYSAMPGRLPDLHKRFAEITMGFFKKHGIQVVGFWTNEIGGPNDQLLYILAYESLADREKKWGAFLADQERLAKFAETEKSGPLVRRLTAHMLRPTPYSPMQ
jgi:hypothetical protein